MSIIDSIRLSGTTYQIQGSGGGITVDPTLDSGSTNPVANSAITTALGDKVNVADNNVSAYTFENKISGVEYGYSEHFAGPIYIRYTGSTSSSGGHYAGNILCYTSEWGWDYIYLDFNLSNGQITATTVSSNYFDVEIENGEAALTFKDGYYLRQYESRNEFVALTKTTYESGQSADVIEDTVYDVFDKLNDKIDKTSDNDVTSNSMYFSDGYLNSRLYIKKQTTLTSNVKIDSSTIKSSNDGLSVQFANSEVADRILNVVSGSYGTLFSTDSYDTSFNEFTITFNPNCTQYGVYYFSVRIIDASNAMYDVTFEYDSSDMSAVYTGLSTYCTVTDTLSTDYKLKVTAKEGYKIARLHNGNYMVGGVDNTNPNNYISNLVTTPSYVHDGQDVIDDIYDKLDDKQDTLVSSQNIKTINNESILGSGNIDIQGGGGKAIEAGRGISITTGETADTVSFNLPISAGTGTDSVAEGNGTTANGNNSHAEGLNTTASGSRSHAEGYYTTASGTRSHAEGDSTTASGTSSHAEGGYTIASASSSHAEGDSTIANGDYSHTEGYQTIANNESEHASGQYNVSSSASTTWGDSGNTLFSVGNGTSDNARHNAFEIRQNGDIYLSSGGTDIKLQDHLGGGGGSSYTAGDGIDITNDVISVTGKVDTSAFTAHTANTDIHVTVADKTNWNAKSDFSGDYNDLTNKLSAGTNITIVDNVISAEGGGSITIDPSLDSGSTNAVESKAIWSATTFNKNVLLTFDENRHSTNYPKGCGKLVVGNIENWSFGSIQFRNDEGTTLGPITINNNSGNITVDTSEFEGATATVDGNNVTIICPSTGITSVRVDDTRWTYTAVVEGAWVNENTYMKLEVDAIASGLQNNINSKLDATAYTPTVVDSTLYAGSTNPVQNKVLYPELRINNGEAETTLTFEDRQSTNYPEGCTKLIVEVVGSNNNSSIHFFNDDEPLGNIGIDNLAGIMVNNRFEGASYEISGTTVIITYPTVTSVTKIMVDGIGNYVYKAITSLTTPLKDQVAANTTALGGLSLVKLTQAEYDALTTKDSNTLYVIVN